MQKTKKKKKGDTENGIEEGRGSRDGVGVQEGGRGMI